MAMDAADRQPVLLIVDGAAHFHRYLRGVFKHCALGARITSALNVTEAKLRIRETRPDLILTDYQFNDGDACAMVRYARDSGVEAPYMVVTKMGYNDLISVGITCRFVSNSMALVFKKDLGMWFGEYVQHTLDKIMEPTDE